MTMPEEQKRAPVLLEGYSLGDEGKPEHFNPNMPREEAKTAAGILQVGDAAFIKRSDLKWTYAIVTDRKEDGPLITLRFDVDQEKNRKSFPESQWGKYIRVINGNAAAAAAKGQGGEGKENEVPSTPKSAGDPKPSVEVKATPKVSNVTPKAGDKAPSDGVAQSTEESVEVPAATEAEAAAPTVPQPVEPAPQAQKPPTIHAAKPSGQKSSGGWFSSFFGSSTPAPAPPAPAAAAARAPSPAPPALASSFATEAAPTEPAQGTEAGSTRTKTSAGAVAAAVAGVPGALKSAVPSDTVIPDVTVNNSTLSDLTELKGVDEKILASPITPKKTPSSILKSFKFSKNKSNSNVGASNPKTVQTPTQSDSSPQSNATNADKNEEGTKKVEWFDPQALECDYDKNPTDLFQALEARQFSYAHEMHKDAHEKFVKDCRTWVIARGKSDEKTLRFRALPLHGAIVFGAEEDLIMKIMKAYPKAARGRDVKGRLPIHLAYEKDVSDEIIDMLMNEFPKGFIAKDKKNMTPFDHIKEDSPRAFLKKLLPQANALMIEEEREKWEVELKKKLEEQKVQLKSDEQYLEDVVQHVSQELEAHHESVLQRTKEKHELDMLDLKKKHAAEMKSLLEGFEVKLEFEKKLNKMKGKGSK